MHDVENVSAAQYITTVDVDHHHDQYQLLSHSFSFFIILRFTHRQVRRTGSIRRTSNIPSTTGSTSSYLGNFLRIYTERGMPTGVKHSSSPFIAPQLPTVLAQTACSAPTPSIGPQLKLHPTTLPLPSPLPKATIAPPPTMLEHTQKVESQLAWPVQVPLPARECVRRRVRYGSCLEKGKEE